MRKIFWLIIILLIGLLPTAAQSNRERVVSQRFEQGEMIYRQSTGDIFVLSSQTGHWWRYSSAQYGHLPANMRTTRPTHRYVPTNGFGQIWANFSAIRDEVGWGVLPEIGFETQIIVRGSEFYVYRFDGRIYHLRANGTWAFVESVPPASSTATINSFVVSPQRVSPGTTLNIQWEITGAQYALIEFYDSSTNIHIGFLEMQPLSGNITWGVPENVQGNIIVRLYAANMHIQPRIVHHFWERLASQEQTATVIRENFTFETAAAYQRFTNGFMIWRADNGDVRIFLNNGEWYIHPEAFYGSLGTNDLAQIADCDLYPVNAFAIIWGTLGNYWNLLGCASAAEVGYTLTIAASGDTFTYSLPDGRQITVTGNRWSQ